MHEYLVKWENRSLEQNSWEPASHLENVPHLLETFEKQLARQKETRAAMQAQQQAAAAAAAANANKTSEAGKTHEPGNLYESFYIKIRPSNNTLAFIFCRCK